MNDDIFSLDFFLSFVLYQTRLEELHRLWDLLLQKTKEKGLRLLQAQKLVQYLRECEDALDWISDKVPDKVPSAAFVFCSTFPKPFRSHCSLALVPPRSTTVFSSLLK